MGYTEENKDFLPFVPGKGGTALIFIEGPGLEGTSGGHLVQPPAQTRTIGGGCP